MGGTYVLIALGLRLFASIVVGDNGAVVCVISQEEAIRIQSERCHDSVHLLARLASPGKPVVWLDATKTMVAVGTLGRGGEAVLGDDNGAIRLSLDGDSAWPTDTTYEIRGIADDQAWMFELEGHDASSVKDLSVPPGKYRLRLEAEKFLPVWRDVINVPARGVVDLGRIRLQPIPRVSGVVVDGNTGVGIGDALIAGPDGRVETTTQSDGYFEIGGGDAPSLLVLSHPGYGSRLVHIRGSGAVIDLGTIRMLPGITLDLDVQLLGDSRIRSVELWRRRDEERAPRLVERIEYDEESSEVAAEFVDLEPGPYIVRVVGEEPLEQHIARVTLADEPLVEKTLAIGPIPMEGLVTYGDDVLAHAKITLSADPPFNPVVIEASAEGGIAGELWTLGSYAVAVNLPDRDGRFLDMRMFEGEKVFLDIHIPSRSLHGRVTDASSGLPVEAASVSIDAEIGQMRSSTMTATDETGTYEVVGARDGTYTVSVRAQGFLPEKRTIQLSKDREGREDFTLRRGSTVAVQLVTHTGVPAANAIVGEGVSQDGFTIEDLGVANAMGIFEVSGEEGKPVRLLVIPTESSFLVTDFVIPANRGANNAPPTLVVPPGDTTLTIVVTDSNGAPVPGVSFVFRHNGIMLPRDFTSLMRSVRGTIMKTGADGRVTLDAFPSGFYEMWPYRTGEELLGILQSAGISSAPVSTGLGAGAYVVEITVD